MLTVRRAEERGRTDLGWLDSRHTFSFGAYQDPAHMGFRALRVLNDDRIAPDKGFGAHGHRDMEILSYVLEGGLAHRDSMGEERVLGPNEVGSMTAGTGVIHSEFNASATAPAHFLQIWILPSARDLSPGYHHIGFQPSEKLGRLRLLAGPDKASDPPSVYINQDARMYAAVLGSGESASHAVAPGRHCWVHCATGHIDVNGLALKAGDGVAVSDEPELILEGSGPAGGELVLFDLA
jgi:redox-sensitive bicupin YhaK (pirin superfamily)